MKSKPIPARVATAGLTLLVAAATAAAHDDGIDARLKGFQEVPAVSTAARGRFKASIDDRARFKPGPRPSCRIVRPHHTSNQRTGGSS